ncbi:MAG: GGDEF domain-containing protein [Nitrospirota bacterium]
MVNSLKRKLKKTMTIIDFGYRLIRGVDYETLSHYILKINQHQNIDSILHEISTCFKEMLDYELFGFVLKNGTSIDVWIDPETYSTSFTEYAARDYDCHKNDMVVHHFRKQRQEKHRNFDAVAMKDLLSYTVSETGFIARLYVLPRVRMTSHYDAILNTIVKSINIALEKILSIQRLENAATIDPLTNCYNRRALCDFIENDIAFTRRFGNELSVIMVDLDNFKKINDIHGHLAGDAVLRELSRLITSQVRKSDYLARYGGEEFVLVLPGTSLYSAVQLAEKLRKKIQDYPIRFGKKMLRVTASFGVANLESKQNRESLLHEADERLYQAKASGRNSVIPNLLPCFADRTFVSKRRMRKYLKPADSTV